VAAFISKPRLNEVRSRPAGASWRGEAAQGRSSLEDEAGGVAAEKDGTLLGVERY
jgi:hypothetical protein